MKAKTIVTIVGARPQFIKAACMSRVFAAANNINEIIVHTGQHFDHNMSDIFFIELAIPQPKYNLEINSSSHGAMTGAMLAKIEQVLIKEQPDAVLVYGDTNSTLAGALAAVKLHIPIIHVEAGLRSFNNKMPEEINRILTDRISNLLFCSTHTSVKNLKQEGITAGVHHVGDIMYDATLFAIDKLANMAFDIPEEKYALITLHRAENTDDKTRFNKILKYMDNFCAQHKLIPIMPVHPRTKQKLLTQNYPMHNFKLRDPIGYFEMHALMKHANYILTDSGGLQKEAYFHRVPCITLRDETEWTELISSGWNRLWHTSDYLTPKKEVNDYGNGNTAKLIYEIINSNYFK